jgi:hypothetical protein
MSEISEKPKLTPTDAIRYIDEAPKIIEDKGRSVFGWEVASPLYSAFKRLDEAVQTLEGVQGAERQLSRAHEMYGDIASKDKTMADPKEVARRAYNKAIKVLEIENDYDGIARITAKLTSL